MIDVRTFYNWTYVSPCDRPVAPYSLMDAAHDWRYITIHRKLDLLRIMRFVKDIPNWREARFDEKDEVISSVLAREDIFSPITEEFVYIRLQNHSGEKCIHFGTPDKMVITSHKHALSDAMFTGAINIKDIVDLPPVIYLSGPISGMDIEVARKNFATAFLDIKDKCPSAIIINPMAEVQQTPRWQWEDYMAKDIGFIPYCTHIYMLPQWHTSKGATIERSIAEAFGLKITYAE